MTQISQGVPNDSDITTYSDDLGHSIDFVIHCARSVPQAHQGWIFWCNTLHHVMSNEPSFWHAINDRTCSLHGTDMASHRHLDCVVSMNAPLLHDELQAGASPRSRLAASGWKTAREWATSQNLPPPTSGSQTARSHTNQPTHLSSAESGPGSIDHSGWHPSSSRSGYPPDRASRGGHPLVSRVGL